MFERDQRRASKESKKKAAEAEALLAAVKVSARVYFAYFRCVYVLVGGV